MQLQLSTKEVAVLRHALDHYLTALRTEASRTDAPSLSRDIWADEHLLTDLRARLGEERTEGAPVMP